MSKGAGEERIHRWETYDLLPLRACEQLRRIRGCSPSQQAWCTVAGASVRETTICRFARVIEYGKRVTYSDSTDAGLCSKARHEFVSGILALFDARP